MLIYPVPLRWGFSQGCYMDYAIFIQYHARHSCCRLVGQRGVSASVLRHVAPKLAEGPRNPCLATLPRYLASLLHVNVPKLNFLETDLVRAACDSLRGAFRHSWCEAVLFFDCGWALFGSGTRRAVGPPLLSGAHGSSRL